MNKGEQIIFYLLIRRIEPIDALVILWKEEYLAYICHWM